MIITYMSDIEITYSEITESALEMTACIIDVPVQVSPSPFLVAPYLCGRAPWTGAVGVLWKINKRRKTSDTGGDGLTYPTSNKCLLNTSSMPSPAPG